MLLANLKTCPRRSASNCFDSNVADVVKLDANNRILVAQGLKRMRAGRMHLTADVTPFHARQIRAVDYRFDFGSLFGTEWEFLNRAQPAGVVFAEGSEVAVYAPSDSTGPKDPAAPP